MVQPWVVPSAVVRTITVAGFKGGVGKTTTAVGLALHAQLSGHNVVLIDADPQRSAWTWLTDHDEDDIQVEVLSTRRPKAEIEALSRGADVVVIDTPPGATDTSITLAAMSAADLVVLPVAPSGLDVDRLAHSVDAAAAVVDRVAVLIVRSEHRWRSHRSLVAALQEDPDVILLDSYIPDRVDIAGASTTAPSVALGCYGPVWAEVESLLEGK